MSAPESATSGSARAILLPAVRALVADARSERAALSADSPDRQFYLGVEAAAEEVLHPQLGASRATSWLDRRPTAFRDGYLRDLHGARDGSDGYGPAEPSAVAGDSIGPMTRSPDLRQSPRSRVRVRAARPTWEPDCGVRAASVSSVASGLSRSHLLRALFLASGSSPLGSRCSTRRACRPFLAALEPLAPTSRCPKGLWPLTRGPGDYPRW